MTGDTNEEHEYDWASRPRLAWTRRRRHDGAPSRPTNPPAGERLKRLMAAGVGVSAIGWSLFIGASDTGARLGLALAAMGALVCLVAAVGFGVSLGVRDAEDRRPR